MTAVSEDCRKCGICCQMAGIVVTFAKVDKRLPRILTKPYVSQPGYEEWGKARRLRVTKNGVCTTLRGEIGKDVTCSIYADRPHVCRVFARGGEDCIRAIDRYNAWKASADPDTWRQPSPEWDKELGLTT